MSKHLLMKGLMGLTLGCASFLSYAASIEGYWTSIDDNTGERLSIIEIKKGADERFHGKIVYRYAVPGGTTLTHCTKCPEPYKNKPIIGLQLLSGFREDPDKPNAYIDGRVIEPKSGKIYKGKANVTADGKRMRMRGYMGVSALGRTVVWLRTDSPNP